MAAGIPTDLLVKTLLSPELDFTDMALGKKREENLKGCIGRMLREDRVELFQALDRIQASLPHPQSSSNRGIETLLIAYDEKTPMNPEYAYRFTTFANYSRAHSNDNVMAKIAAVRAALLKVIPIETAPLPTPQEIRSAIRNAIACVQEKIQAFDQKMAKLQDCLLILTQMEASLLEVKAQGGIFSQDSSTSIQRLCDKIRELNGPHSLFAKDAELIFKLIVKLPFSQTCTNLEELQKELQLNLTERELPKKSTGPIGREKMLTMEASSLYIMREEMLTMIASSLYRITSEVKAQMVEVSKEKSEIENEKHRLEKRLGRYESYVAKAQKKQDELIDEFYDPTREKKQELKTIEAIYSLISPLANPEIQNLEEMRRQLIDIQAVINAHEHALTPSLREILQLLNGISEGHNVINPLHQSLKDLIEVRGQLDSKTNPAFNRITAYTRLSSDVFNSEEERIKVIKDVIGIAMAVLDSLKTKLSHELYDLEGAPVSSPQNPAPATLFDRLTALKIKEKV